MVATSGAVGVDPYVGYCARLRRELSGEPDVGNLHLRFDEGRGTCSVPSYSTGSDRMVAPRAALGTSIGQVRLHRKTASLRSVSQDKPG